jgi:16S rRNA (uracil1498-N3)-methyltransferase
VQLLSRVEPPPEPAVHLTLAQAVLKGEKMDDVVRDAVMLGVAAIQPIVTRRTEVTVAALVRGARVDRWRRVALASAKQSRRAVLPEVRVPLTFDDFLDEPPPALRLMLVEPGAGHDAQPLSALRQERPPSDAALLIGPEGGWDEREWTAARDRGIRLISLGPRTLRADAVPVAAISVLEFLWDLSC